MPRRNKRKKLKPINLNNIPLRELNKIIDDDVVIKREISNIKSNIEKENEEIYQLRKEKVTVLETLVDKMLLDKEMTTLISQYIELSDNIRTRELKNSNRRADLNFKKEKIGYDDEKDEIIHPEKNFLTADDSSEHYIGLYNKICHSPVAKCLKKNVYLSDLDIRCKKCLKQRNHQMCKHLAFLKDDGLISNSHSSYENEEDYEENDENYEED